MFDHEYYNSERKFFSAGNREYDYHHVMVWVNSGEYANRLVFQPGQSYLAGDFSAPNPELEVSLDGGSEEQLVDITLYSNDELADMYPDLTAEEIEKTRGDIENLVIEAKKYMSEQDFVENPDYIEHEEY